MNGILAFSFGGLTACVFMRVILCIIQLIDTRRSVKHNRERRHDTRPGGGGV